MLPSIGEASSEETPDEVEKGVELVVVNPMPGALERDHTGMPEVVQATVGLRVRGPAFLAVDRIGARVIVEFPAVGAVLILVDAVLGQVARLLGREMPVGLLHAL